MRQLREVSAAAIEYAPGCHEQGEAVRGVTVIANGGREFVVRMNDLFAEQDTVFLEVLGGPAIQGAAASLTAGEPVPIYKSLVVKSCGDGQESGWHRDMLHDRTSRVFTVGVYPFEVLPGRRHHEERLGTRRKQLPDLE